MSTPVLVAVRRVKDLIRLAIDPGAADGESCNAARSACRLIMRHELVIAAPGTYEPPSYSPRPAPRRERVEYDDRPMDHDREITNKFATYCRRCREPIEVGDRCFWRKGFGCTCWECGS